MNSSLPRLARQIQCFATTSVSIFAVVGGAPTASGQGENAAEFERIVRSYGNLETAAGLGNSEDDNGWKPEFEGAKAKDVELSNPHMTVADTAGNLYIADKESNSILKIDPTGVLTTFAGTHAEGESEGSATEAQLSQPNGLFNLPDGTVYILDLGNRRICKVGLDGILSSVLQDSSGFGAGRGLWVQGDGKRIFYNGPGRVMEWTPANGSRIYASGFSDLGNITVDPKGNLVVTDRGAHLVYRVSADGAKTIIAGDGSTDDPIDGRPAISIGLDNVRGVAFRQDGSYFLCTQKGGDVVLVDTKGIAHVFVAGADSGNVRAGDGEPVSTPGDKISEPRAVTLAPNGNVLITTNDKGFIRVVRALRPPSDQSIHYESGRGIVLTWNLLEGSSVAIDSTANLSDWQTIADALVDEEYAVPSSNGSAFYRLLPQR